MKSRDSRHSRRLLAKDLAAAMAAFQAAVIIPRCPTCANPCCKLETLVLELNWKQLKSFWQLAEPRTVFDKRLSTGKGPKEVRAGNGLYYIHGKACPAYDEERTSCRVYDQEIKPVGCTDFPVYQDQDCIIADLRCEAVDLKVLEAWVARTIGQGFRITQSADKEFPFLVTLSVKKSLTL
ncbi:MAG: hypothetical protein RIR18_1290 [Pseudomonadota bacterium]|jgi:Fe-S-cluster containining protein